MILLIMQFYMMNERNKQLNCYELSYNFKLMAFTKELLSIISNITELVLQSRNYPNHHFTNHLQHIQNDLSLLSKQHSPSNQFVQFLISKPSYSIKSKLHDFIKKNSPCHIIIQLQFIVSDKINSLTEAAQTWNIYLRKIGQNNIGKGEISHQLIHLVNMIVSKLLSDNYYNSLLGDKQSGKKYVFDYKINISQKISHSNKYQLIEFGSLNQIKAAVNQNYEIQLNYLQRLKQNSFINTISLKNILDHQPINYKPSQDTSLGDSNDSRYRIHRKRYHSNSQSLQLFDLYDEELGFNIISSQNSQSGPKNETDGQYNAQEDQYLQKCNFFQQIDSFELLVEDAKSQEELFVEQNQILFKNWEKSLLTIFL